MHTCLLLLDYSKAFDTLDHDMLCLKLKYFGLHASAVDFLNDYLLERSQRVVLDNIFSDVLSLNRGVPQGSILGPLLFSLYTSDFASHLKHLKSHQYADDLQLYYSFNAEHGRVAETLIKRDLKVIHKMSTTHSLLLNQSKTMLMLFGKNDNILSNSLNIELNNVKIPISETCKNLGVFFDSNMRFRTHVSSLLQRSYGKLRTLYLFKQVLSTQIKLRLCDSLILSLLSYCDILFWPALLLEDKESLQKLQNSCLRLCYGLRKYDHISQSFLTSGWFKLEQRFHLHLCTLVYKINKFRQPEYLFEKLTKGSDVHGRLTRYNDLFSAPRHRTAMFQRSFTYNAVKNYNALPLNVKDCSGVETFKKRLRTHLRTLND